MLKFDITIMRLKFWAYAAKFTEKIWYFADKKFRILAQKEIDELREKIDAMQI